MIQVFAGGPLVAWRVIVVFWYLLMISLPHVCRAFWFTESLRHFSNSNISIANVPNKVDRLCLREISIPFSLKVQSQKKRQQQHELIAELRRRQAKDHRPVYEGKDGTIEDIITGGTHRTANPIIPSSRITVVVLGSAQQQCTICYATQCPLQPKWTGATLIHCDLGEIHSQGTNHT